jgi:hypothetical protein
MTVSVLHRVDIVVVIVNDTSVQKFTQIHNAPDVTSLESVETKFVDTVLPNENGNATSQSSPEERP